jgi:hypothetical protein
MNADSIGIIDLYVSLKCEQAAKELLMTSIISNCSPENESKRARTTKDPDVGM